MSEIRKYLDSGRNVAVNNVEAIGFIGKDIYLSNQAMRKLKAIAVDVEHMIEKQSEHGKPIRLASDDMESIEKLKNFVKNITAGVTADQDLDGLLFSDYQNDRTTKRASDVD